MQKYRQFKICSLKISLIEKIVLSYIGAIGGLGLMLAIFNPLYFDKSYAIEDGLLEWLQFFGLATIAVIAWHRVFTLVGRAHWSGALILILTALFFTLISGEEISWGQRLFNVSAPEFFVEHNKQVETNLHNLTWQGINFNKLIFGKGLALLLLLYGLVLTPLYQRRRYVWVDRALLPIPHLYQLLAMVIIVCSVEGLVKNLSEVARRGELTEFAGVFVVLLIMLYPFNQSIYRQ